MQKGDENARGTEAQALVAGFRTALLDSTSFKRLLIVRRVAGYCVLSFEARYTAAIMRISTALLTSIHFLPLYRGMPCLEIG